MVLKILKMQNKKYIYYQIFLKNQIEYINTNSIDNFIDIKNFQNNNNNTIKNAFINV